MIKLPEMPSMSLEGKTALITGASSGIGQGAAVALAFAGASVICVARGEDRLVETEKALKEKNWTVTSAVVDINDHSAVQNIFANHEIDIVVNAAGQARHSAAVDTTSEDYDACDECKLKICLLYLNHCRKINVRESYYRVYNSHIKSNGSCWRCRPRSLFCIKACIRGNG
jgi:2-deoxy-D-gluconate 3-dehydrogenase